MYKIEVDRVNALLSAVLTLCAVLPSWAAPVSVKIGYFHLNKVTKLFPKDPSGEILPEQSALERRVSFLNSAGKRIYGEEPLTFECVTELEERAAQLQKELDGRAICKYPLVTTTTPQAVVNQSISLVASIVARERGLDLVIDTAKIFFFRGEIKDYGEDLTEDIIKRLY